ncbi:Growth-regulating factor 1 [Bienertia sinuspersici]
MQFGVMGSNGVIVSGNGFSSMSSDYSAKRKWCGSTDFLNKQMSEISYDNEVLKQPTNFAKLSGDFSDNQQQHNMLSFSSPKLGTFSPIDSAGLENKSLLQNSTFHNLQHPNSFYSKNGGYSCKNGSINATNMHFMNGVKGAFTATQWFELEQQALIYKYIIANEPIPPTLLIPIRRAFESAAFSAFPVGWGPFHLGLANTDPEAGRCRRTDGKKWRCSRDAVPDQKYCERHINRGRHRSRKPVEGHTGHSIFGVTTNKSSKSNTTNVMNMTSSSSALVVPGGGPSNSFAINLNQSKDLLHVQPVISNNLPSSLDHRSILNNANSSQRMQNTSSLDILSPRINQNSRATENTFSIAKPAAGDFSFLTSEAPILNTAQDGSFVSRTYAQSQPSFIDDDSSSILWPKLDTQTNKYTTKLSISIPPADFMSSTSSPTGERIALSPLRLSREVDPVKVHIGSNVSLCLDNTVSNEQSSISWDTSIGGPLGEALKTTTSNSSGEQSKSVSALNLLSKGSEGSPQLTSSPTGVLQRTALGYFSNSSAGSSPRAENGRALESGTHSRHLISFTLGNSSSLSRCN